MNSETIQEMGAVAGIVTTLVAAACAFAYALLTSPPIRIQSDFAVFQSGLDPASTQVRFGFNPTSIRPYSKLIRANPTHEQKKFCEKRQPKRE